MAKISQLYNKDKEKIYPLTSSDAVINSNTGYPISSEIAAIKNSNIYGQITLSKISWTTNLTKNVKFDQSTFSYDPSSSIVYIYPTEECIKDYKNSGIECTNISGNTFTFTAKVLPQNNIVLDIFVIMRNSNNV